METGGVGGGSNYQHPQLCVCGAEKFELLLCFIAAAVTGAALFVRISHFPAFQLSALPSHCSCQQCQMTRNPGVVSTI